MANMTLKKRPMDKKGYEERMEKSREQLARAAADPLRLRYHLQPPMGWLNDPNGLCQKDGVYHIYHQYVPFYPDLCSVFWGHVTTGDFIHYEAHEPAIFPDCAWDKNGAYSGSAFVEEGTMHIFYTGNVRHTDGDYDYITAGREQNTIGLTSEDGFHFTEKRLLMTNADYPSDVSLHVRDPQVFRENGRYYMIQGARDLKARGSVLLFESENLKDWTYKMRFHRQEAFGYMWECPNYLRIGEAQFLIACPQGIKAKGLDFAEANQCGYFPFRYDFGGTDYELGEFVQLDRGFDFYAPQVFRDESGRWILFGWMSTPDAQYESERTMENGWIHAMTVPRELYVNGKGRLCQRPVMELKRMRENERHAHIGAGEGFEEEIPVCFEAELTPDKPGEDFELLMRESAVLRYQDGILSLDMACCGDGRGARGVRLPRMEQVRVLSDTSSLEIFVNGGEEVFTTRIYDSMSGLRVRFASDGTGARMSVFDLVKR